MTSFNNRFWGVRRLKHSSLDGTDLRAQVEPYLDWRMIALDDTSILLCKPTVTVYPPDNEDMIIIEDVLMDTWIKHRASDV
jgi:hypothetical protein